MTSRRALTALIAASLLLAACGGTRTLGSLEQKPATDGPPKQPPTDLASVPDAVPKNEPLSKLGNPDSYVVLGKRYDVLNSSENFTQRGYASWYGRKFQGRRTSSGEPYDMYRMTAAHKTLPLPSYVRVTNLDNGRQVIVRVNDRGPFHADRIIDLSYAAAVRLDMIGNGTVPVKLEALSPGDEPTDAAADPALYLQVGAFSQAENARDLAQRLESMGLTRVSISPTDDGKPLYRVRVGPYADHATMDGVRRDLQQQGIATNTLRD